MNKQLRWKVSGALLGVFALAGCGNILDVTNPNNLVEDDVQKLEAAAATVNGAEALVYEAIGQIYAPYHVSTDELYWIGSRDAWFTLDQGAVDDPFNEFTDAAFPFLGQARWMADYALETVQGHIAEESSAGLLDLQARANLYAGLIYMIIAEVQQDFAFSDRNEGAPAVGASNMGTVFDQAITYFDAAVSGAGDITSGGDAFLASALGLRARAKHSKAVRAKIQPSIAADPLVADAGAAADAQAALDQIDGASLGADWTYQATFSASTIDNSMSFEVNNRQESDLDPGVATRIEDDDGALVGYDAAVLDPVTGEASPALQKRIDAFRVAASNWQPIDLITARYLHLILAENALAGGGGDFAGSINAIRSLDGLTPYGGGSDMDMLMHSRQVNAFLMGVRLADMYRFGIQADLWLSTSTAVLSPGTLLPITCVEIRANENLSGC